MAEDYVASVNDEGKVVVKKTKNITQGKKSRKQGSQFETRVRKDLEEKGWVVAKWPNNVDIELGKIVPAKRKLIFSNFVKISTIGTGFPDFIAFRRMGEYYKIIGVEVKINGILSKKEKEKCRWYLNNGIFNEILIAKKLKEKNRVKIEYKSFE